MVSLIFGNVQSVAIRTGRGCRFIEENEVVVHRLPERMAGRARHILMAALQRKRRLLMVEQRGLPFVAVVAGLATVGARAKLVHVRIFVALAAGRGSTLELHMPHGQFHVRGLVAIGTNHGSMRAHERKACLRVVELRQIFPFLRRVAGLATKRLAPRPTPCHPLGEFAFMNILVATGAKERIEMIERNLGASQRLVAIVTGHGFMTAGQWEAGLLMLGQRVVRRPKSGTIVALLAAIAPRFGCELALVLILVAIHTLRKVDLVAGLLASRRMAVGTLHFAVRKHQWEARLGMLGSRIGGRDPALHCVATLATASIGALQELAAVRVGLVAIRTERVFNGRLEIAAFMAGEASHLKVFSLERKVRLRVIEVRCERRLFPGRGGVAGFATLLELALVRIGMASGTGGEL